MKIGEWDTLGRARAVLQRQLGELGAAEYAAHVAVNPQNGRLRILVATDVGLIDYHFQPAGPDTEEVATLRGQVYRWVSVKGLRLQTDAQVDGGDAEGEGRWIWRLSVEDPKIELTAESTQSGERSPDALLPFAKACIEHAS